MVLLGQISVVLLCDKLASGTWPSIFHRPEHFSVPDVYICWSFLFSQHLNPLVSSLWPFGNNSAALAPSSHKWEHWFLKGLWCSSVSCNISPMSTSLFPQFRSVVMWVMHAHKHLLYCTLPVFCSTSPATNYTCSISSVSSRSVPRSLIILCSTRYIEYYMWPTGDFRATVEAPYI